MEDEDLATAKFEFQKKEDSLFKLWVLFVMWNFIYHAGKIATYYIYMAKVDCGHNALNCLDRA